MCVFLKKKKYKITHDWMILSQRTTVFSNSYFFLFFRLNSSFFAYQDQILKHVLFYTFSWIYFIICNYFVCKWHSRKVGKHCTLKCFYLSLFTSLDWTLRLRSKHVAFRKFIIYSQFKKLKIFSYSLKRFQF